MYTSGNEKCTLSGVKSSICLKCSFFLPSQLRKKCGSFLEQKTSERGVLQKITGMFLENFLAENLIFD